MGVDVSRQERKGPRIVPLGWGRGLGSNKTLIVRTLSHSPEPIPGPVSSVSFLKKILFICLFGCFRSSLHHVRSFVGGTSVVAGHGLCSPLHVVS